MPVVLAAAGVAVSLSILLLLSMGHSQAIAAHQPRPEVAESPTEAICSQAEIPDETVMREYRLSERHWNEISELADASLCSPTAHYALARR